MMPLFSFTPKFTPNIFNLASKSITFNILSYDKMGVKLKHCRLTSILLTTTFESMGTTKERLLSVKEVGSRADISRQRVLQLIESNELQAEMVGRNYVIRESDFEAWSNSRRKAGRPPKAKIEEN